MVDTGLIYRLVARGVLDSAVDPDDREAVLKVSVGVLKDGEGARSDTGGGIKGADRPPSERRLPTEHTTRAVPPVAPFRPGGGGGGQITRGRAVEGGRAPAAGG